MIAATRAIAAFIASSSAHAQQSGEDPVTATPRLQDMSSKSDNAAPVSTQSSPSDDQTQDALAVTGRMQEKDALVLADSVTEIKYSLDNQARVTLR